jgi:hypothetical protein
VKLTSIGIVIINNNGEVIVQSTNSSYAKSKRLPLGVKRIFVDFRAIQGDFLVPPSRFGFDLEEGIWKLFSNSRETCSEFT